MSRAKRCQFNNVKFKSMFERDIAKILTDQGVRWEYEPDKFEWQPPVSTYSPDFKVYNEDGSFYYIETKGNFKPTDRVKMYCVKQQHPELDVRFIFMTPTNKLLPRSKTSQTYADWAEKHDYPVMDVGYKRVRTPSKKKKCKTPQPM